MTQAGTPRMLRAMNDRAALDLLLTHGPLSRARLGELTGLSKPTASQLLARLEADGLVVAGGTSSGRPGPGARLYGLNPRAAYVAGLDVSLDGVRAAVADVTGRTVGTHTATAGADAVASVLLAVDGAACDAGLRRADLHRVVIGSPGAFDPRTGRLRYASHLPGWHSPTLLADLTAALPMPVEHDNDANLAAVAEHHLGAAAGQDDFVLLWNEIGIGAALVLGGRLHRGMTGGAGELGFLPVPGAPLVRDAARVGSGGFQESAGASAVLRLAHELGAGRGCGPTPHAAAASLLRQAASSAPDGPQAELLARFAAALATGLAAVIAVLDPPLIVLSGALLTAGGERLCALVREELAALTPAQPRLVPAAVTATPVLDGALHSALTSTRDEVFDTSRHRGE
jgi:predicted NBD/HSP70 family sugar kinase